MDKETDNGILKHFAIQGCPKIWELTESSRPVNVFFFWPTLSTKSCIHVAATKKPTTPVTSKVGTEIGDIVLQMIMSNLNGMKLEDRV